MEPDISGYPGLEENRGFEPSPPDLHHASVAESLEADDYKNQVLYDTDGQAFNLSSVGWHYDSYLYDYDTNNNINNIIKNNTSDLELVPPERAVAWAVFLFMFFVGFITNALLVYTVVRYRARRRGTNLYFLNISVSDLVYLLVCLPTVSVSYALVDWTFGNSLCKLENYVISVTMSVNSLTVLAAGLQQYIAATHPSQSALFRSTKARVWMLSFVWILSCALMVPKALIVSEITAYHSRGPVTLCGRNSEVTSRQIDTAFTFIVLYLLPLLMLATGSCMIGRTLWHNTRADCAPKSPLKKTHVRCSRRNAKIIFTITAVFAIGWLPLHVYQLVEDFDYGNILFGEYIDRGTVALFISFGNKMVNPIFFYLFNRRYTRPVNGIFKCNNSSTGAANHTSCIASSLQRAEVIWSRSVPSLPVAQLSDMLPPRHDRLTSNRELTLAKSPSCSHLQPLLKKPARSCDCKCRSGLSGRPDSWPCAKEGQLMKPLSCSCTTFTEKDGD